MRASSLLASAQRFLRSPRRLWARDAQLWAELFATANLGILAGDICIAHALNHFRKLPEYIPVVVSLGAALYLAAALYLRWVRGLTAPWRIGGQVVGWLSILTGLAGVLYHLESSFFLERTLRSLTYAAPFAAPLAYTGLGFLLLLNRSVEARTAEWARWVVFLALGGFAGNFVLSLTDHAENGFFVHAEWIPVFSSAIATGFLLVPLLRRVTRLYLDLCCAVLLLQAVVGVLGFWFHLQANLAEPGHTLWDKMVNGAPPLAPLLFPNLVGLALIGLWALVPHLPEAPGRNSWLGAVYAWANPE